MDKYLKAIREDVCSICADSDEHGECKLSDKEICAIEFFLPQVVEIIHNTKNDDYDELYNSLKKVICQNCRARDEEGYCYLRDNANCTLERYFSIIIDSVNRVDEAA